MTEFNEVNDQHPWSQMWFCAKVRTLTIKMNWKNKILSTLALVRNNKTVKQRLSEFHNTYPKQKSSIKAKEKSLEHSTLFSNNSKLMMEKNYSEKWNLLLSDKRFREKSPTIPSDGRNPFENDYGRLISSAPIRRLQDKTQVFPLERSDYIRTRLTHSLEVSYIASSIGQSIEKYLISRKELNHDKIGYLSSLLRVAGLVHDLGNPPFGHFGEEAIKDFFRHYFHSNMKIGLNEKEQADYENFDGNVQTFRIMSKLYYFGDEFSFNLTYSTLSSIVKYPSNSKEGNQGKGYGEIAKKKFGYFVTEEKKYKEISRYLQLNNRRSPVAYLLEAADDIAYCAADLEDGVKLGVVKIDEIRDVLSNNLKTNRKLILEEFDKLCCKFKDDGKLKDSLIVQNFRIIAQREMISAVLECFQDHYSEIMEGRLEKELLDISSASDIRETFKELQKIIFKAKSVLKKEVAGWEAVQGLLKIFIDACLNQNDFKADGNTYESRLYNIISTNYRKNYEDIEQYSNNVYKRIQLVVDFISGMTDRYAIDLYQELKGIKL